MTAEDIRSELDHLAGLEYEAGKASGRGDYTRSEHYGRSAAESLERIENMIRTLDPR